MIRTNITPFLTNFSITALAVENQYLGFRKFIRSEQYFLIVQTRSVMVLVRGNVFLEMFM